MIAPPLANLFCSLANIEMRLILAKMLWHFDIGLAEPEKEWTDQMIYTTWEKIPLMITLTPVKRE